MSTTEAQRKLEDKTIHLTVYISFFRSLVMRASYVAQDRPDISEAVKCLARRMHQPTESDYQDLKRLVRFLKGFKGRPRVLLKFGHQKFADTIHVHVDADFAGCLLMRHSTSGLVAAYGRHTVKTSSTRGHTDSSAALGTCNLQGLGCSRHVQTRFLWAQEKLAQEFSFAKIATKLNQN